MGLNNVTIGFIGAGNMANALIKGLIKSGTYKPDQIAASDNDTEKLGQISDTFGIRPIPGNKELVRESRIILLAVKPQVIREVLEEIRDEIRDDGLVVSIAAGIPIKMIHSVIGRDVPIIRVMPNTPALIQRGMSALAAGQEAKTDHLRIAEEIFKAVGKTVVVDENMMDAVTALSGSGPGYVFKIMECFVEAGENQGFDMNTALLLITQTFLGAVHLAEESEESLHRLREMVTSPGGTTAAALTYFEENDLSGLITGAVEAASRRSIELGNNY